MLIKLYYMLNYEQNKQIGKIILFIPPAYGSKSAVYSGLCRRAEKCAKLSAATAENGDFVFFYGKNRKQQIFKEAVTENDEVFKSFRALRIYFH